jgi:hypothetical protein
MDLDINFIRNKMHNLIDSDDHADIEELNKLTQLYQDARFARRSKIHNATMCNIWRQNVHIDMISLPLRKVREGYLCIYVEDVDRYIAFDNVEYYATFLALCKTFEESAPGIIATPLTVKQVPHYQIVPTHLKQKLVLTYRQNVTSAGTLSDEIRDDIKRQVKECFGSESTIVYNNSWGVYQITIDKFIDNFDTVHEYQNKLCYHISKSANYYKNINTPPIINDYDTELTYTMPILYQNMDELNKYINIVCDRNIIKESNSICTQNANTILENTAINLPPEKLQQDVTHEFIYFIIELPYNNNVKIGKSKNIEDRIKTLQTGNPNILHAYYKIYVPVSINLESSLHRHYAERRCNGEWFTFTINELDAEIKILQSIYKNSQKNIIPKHT